jgi:hypothetical protein
VGAGRSTTGCSPATARGESARLQALCCDSSREKNQDQEERHREQARGAKQRGEEEDSIPVHAPETAGGSDVLRRIRGFHPDGRAS